MESLFLHVVFGHFIGDFFLQHKKMADNKNQTGWNAFFWCTVHVIVYSLTVAAFAGDFSPLFLLGVGIPHWLGDRFKIAYQWMKLTGGSELFEQKDAVGNAFAVAIYIVIDQVYHLGCLYLLLLWLY